MTEMNVVEAYIKFNKQMIILISGLPGSYKSEVAKNLAKDFKLSYHNLREYTKADYNTEVELPNGSKMVDWDSVDAFDWDKVNETLENEKSKGIVMVGTTFPSNYITANIDNHSHIKISKRNYITRRHENLKKNPDKGGNAKLVELIDTPTESLMINKVIFPNYLQNVEKSNINKFINANEMSADDIYDDLFDYLLNSMVMPYINRYNKKKFGDNPSNDNASNGNRTNNGPKDPDDSTTEEEDEDFIIATVDPSDKYLKLIQ